MTRSEYDRLMLLGAGLWAQEQNARTVEAWWHQLQDYTLADAEDALRRLVRTHKDWPSLAVILEEVQTIRRGRPRARPVPHVWSEQERERLLRFARLIQEATSAGRLDVVRRAMDEAARCSPPGDPLAAGESALRPSPAIA
jgi:hypothetical protein